MSITIFVLEFYISCYVKLKQFFVVREIIALPVATASRDLLRLETSVQRNLLLKWLVTV